MKKKKIFLAVASIILVASIFSHAANAMTKEMDDIKTHWGKEYIKDLMERHAINGYPDGTFKPDATITKAEFTKILVTALGYDDIENSTDGHWALNYMDKAEKLDIIENNELGNIDEPINRGQMARMIVNASGEELLGKEEYEKVAGRIADIDDIYWKYKLHVAKAFNDNIITGYDDKTFRYDNTATRAEASTMIVRLLEEEKREDVKYDEGQKWYKELSDLDTVHYTQVIKSFDAPGMEMAFKGENRFSINNKLFIAKKSDFPIKVNEDFIITDVDMFYDKGFPEKLIWLKASGIALKDEANPKNLVYTGCILDGNLAYAKGVSFGSSETYSSKSDDVYYYYKEKFPGLLAKVIYGEAETVNRNEEFTTLNNIGHYKYLGDVGKSQYISVHVLNDDLQGQSDMIIIKR